MTMSADISSTSEYLLLFRGNSWDHSLSPADLQKTLSAFVSWFERLSAEGVLKAGQPLEDEGRLLVGKGGKVVADGPFAESKETIGGYFLIYARSLEEAVEIARECPTLAHGAAVEVRPIAASCPHMNRVQAVIDSAKTAMLVS